MMTALFILSALNPSGLGAFPFERPVVSVA